MIIINIAALGIFIVYLDSVGNRMENNNLYVMGLKV